jgi:hypothetical protein
LFAASVCLLVACAPGAPAAGGAAGRNVEAYLLARTRSDVGQMISLSCAAWEPQARVEAASFKSMQAQLDGVACTVESSDGANATVNCSGRIKTSYNGDNRDWPLDQRPFSSVFEGGEWRMCGYK